MPNFSLRRYDTQARFGLLLSLASVVSLMGLAFIVLQNLQNMVIYYGNTRRAAIYGMGMITLMMAVAGFGFGLNSAGQRRNDKPMLSWISFFIGAVVLCLTVVLLFFFYRQGEPATIQ